MTKFVREYRLFKGGVQTVELSKGAAIFHVDWREGMLLLFAPFDSDLPLEERRVYSLGNFEAFEPNEPVRHAGTVKTESGYLHIIVSEPARAPSMSGPLPLSALPPEIRAVVEAGIAAQAAEDAELNTALEDAGEGVRQEEN